RDRRLHDVRGPIGECGEDPAGVKPSHAELAEEVVPVHIGRTKLAGRRESTIGDTKCAARAEAPLGKVQSIADGPADAVVRRPMDECRIAAALQDQILDETADIVVGEGGHNGGTPAEAAPQTTGDVVFTTAFPYSKGACRPNTTFAGVQP